MNIFLSLPVFCMAESVLPKDLVRARYPEGVLRSRHGGAHELDQVSQINIYQQV